MMHRRPLSQLSVILFDMLIEDESMMRLEMCHIKTVSRFLGK